LLLVYLSRELMAAAQSPGLAADRTEHDAVNIVVLQAGDRQFGLVVDAINDTEEIVVKPLGKQLKGISVLAGATIMGDGKVALILDVLGIARHASVVSEVRERVLVDKVAQSLERADDRQTLLLVRGPDDGRMAIPLSSVARLEEFPPAAVERAGDQEMVQYRGQILPLLHISAALPERRQRRRHPAGQRAGDEAHVLRVVVYAEDGHSVGLVVDGILDIVEETLTDQRPASRDGVLGCVVIQGRITELLDVQGIIRAAHPKFFEQPAAAPARG
jgi:two-component system chemotaxis sensor kinase CheA